MQTPAAAPAPRHSKDRSRSTSLHAGSATRRVTPQKGSTITTSVNLKVAIIIAVPVVLVLIGFIAWVSWYNSSDQKLQRCITAEGRQWETKVQPDPQAQMIHTAGGDPPMTLAILDCEDKLGIKH